MHPGPRYVITSNVPPLSTPNNNTFQHNFITGSNQALRLAQIQADTSIMETSDTRESNIRAALKAIEEGRMTYLQAHETYGIGVGTLHGRKNGAKPRREAHRI